MDGKLAFAGFEAPFSFQGGFRDNFGWQVGGQQEALRVGEARHAHALVLFRKHLHGGMLQSVIPPDSANQRYSVQK